MDIEEQRQTSPNAPLQKSPPRQQNQEKLSSATQHSNTIVTQKNQKRPPSKSFDSSDGQNNDNKKPKIIKEEIIKQQIVAKKVQLMSPIPANSIFSTRMETENSDSIDNVSEIMSEFEDPAAYYDFAKRVRGGKLCRKIAKYFLTAINFTDSISSDFDISDGQPDFSGILTSPTPGINIPNMSPLPFHPKELKNAGKPSDSKDVNHNQQNNGMLFKLFTTGIVLKNLLSLQRCQVSCPNHKGSAILNFSKTYESYKKSFHFKLIFSLCFNSSTNFFIFIFKCFSLLFAGTPR